MGGSWSLLAARRSFRWREQNLHRDSPVGLVRVLARALPFFPLLYRIKPSVTCYTTTNSSPG